MRVYIAFLLICFLQIHPTNCMAQDRKFFERSYPTIILKDSTLHDYVLNLKKNIIGQMQKDSNWYVNSVFSKNVVKAVLIHKNTLKSPKWILVDSLIGYDMRDVKKISLTFDRRREVYPYEAPYGFIAIEFKNDSSVNSKYLSHSLGMMNLALAQSASHYNPDTDSLLLGSEYFDRNIAFYFHKGKLSKKPLDSLIKANNLKYVDVHIAPSIYDARTVSTTHNLEPFIIFSPMSKRKRKKLEKAAAIYRKALTDSQLNEGWKKK